MTTDTTSVAFGTLKNLVMRTAKGKPFATFEIEAVNGNFTVSCTAGLPKAIDELKAIGNGGPIYARGEYGVSKRRNAAGRDYEESVLRCFFVSENSRKEAAGDKADDAPAEAPAGDQATGDDLTLIRGIGATIAGKLIDAGIDSFEAIIAASPEELEAVSENYSIRAEKGNWATQAKALSDAANETAADAGSPVEDGNQTDETATAHDQEIPF